MSDGVSSMHSFQYRFQGSSEVRTISLDKETVTGTVLCDSILKDIFGSNPTCTLSVDLDKVSCSQLVEVKREYGKKFEVARKPVQKVRRKPVRRWRSRSPRWRSRSPNRYNRLYTMNNNY